MLLLVLGSIASVTGDLAWALWAKDRNTLAVVLCGGAWAASNWIWLRVLAGGGLGVPVALWTLLTLILAVVAGVVLLGEVMTARQWAGVAVALAALYLLGFDKA